MQTLLTGIIITLPTLTLAITLLVRGRERIPRSQGGSYRSMYYPLNSGVKALVLIAGLAPLATPLVWQASRWYGVGYVVVTYAFIALGAIELDTHVSVHDAVLLLVGLLWITAVVTLFPVALQPRLSPVFFKTQPTQAPRPIDAAFIEASSKSIQHSMNLAVTDIQREQARIQIATFGLVTQVNDQNRALHQLAEQRDALARDIERERALATLTTDQADAIRATLTRGKYIEYIVGFAIGVISSVVASFALRLVQHSDDRTH